MDRTVPGESGKPGRAKALQSPRQRGVIGDRKVDFEQLGKGTKEALGLAKWKMKDHADRERRLDRNVRIGALATRLAAGRSAPGIECGIGEPDGEIAALL